MTVKAFFTAKYRRWSCAVLTSLVTSFVGLYPSPTADAQPDPCTLRDVSHWQTQLTDSINEKTPDYIRSVTEDFLARCPDRPEAGEAHQIAAMAAADAGDAKASVKHFRAAGRVRDMRAQFYFAAALLKAGEAREAWTVRDAIIADWAAGLKHRPFVSLESETVRHGTLYKLRFTSPDPETGIVAAWVAVPSGPGWPATLSIGAERQLTAFHRMRAGQDAKPLRHVDLYRCRGRKLMARTEAAIPAEQMDEAARITLIAYLGNPDTDMSDSFGTTLPLCLWPSRLLPKPNLKH